MENWRDKIMITGRYNLDGNAIRIIKCKSCGHEVDITDLEKLINSDGINGMDCKNVLVIVDAVQNSVRPSSLWSGCCDMPDYDLFYEKRF